MANIALPPNSILSITVVKFNKTIMKIIRMQTYKLGIKNVVIEIEIVRVFVGCFVYREHSYHNTISTV